MLTVTETFSEEHQLSTEQIAKLVSNELLYDSANELLEQVFKEVQIKQDECDVPFIEKFVEKYRKKFNALSTKFNFSENSYDIYYKFIVNELDMLIVLYYMIHDIEHTCSASIMLKTLTCQYLFCFQMSLANIENNEEAKRYIVNEFKLNRDEIKQCVLDAKGLNKSKNEVLHDIDTSFETLIQTDGDFFQMFN